MRCYFTEDTTWIWESFPHPVPADFSAVCVLLYTCPCCCLAFKFMCLQKCIKKCIICQSTSRGKNCAGKASLCYKKKYSGFSSSGVPSLHNKSQTLSSDVHKLLSTDKAHCTVTPCCYSQVAEPKTRWTPRDGICLAQLKKKWSSNVPTSDNPRISRMGWLKGAEFLERNFNSELLKQKVIQNLCFLIACSKTE